MILFCTTAANKSNHQMAMIFSVVALALICPTALSERVVSVTGGQTAIVKCSLDFGGNTISRFWQYSSGSLDQLISTCDHGDNVTPLHLVTQFPSNGILIWNDAVPLHVKDRLLSTATFDLIILNVSIHDNGCYVCGKLDEDAEELDNPTLVIVTLADNYDVKLQKEDSFSESDKSDVMQQDPKSVTDEPRKEASSNALVVVLVVINIALFLLLIFLTIIILKILPQLQKHYSFLEAHNRLHPMKPDTSQQNDPEQAEREVLLKPADSVSPNKDEFSGDNFLVISKIPDLLSNVDWQRILNWTAAQSKRPEKDRVDSSQILQHIYGCLRRSKKRQHNTIVNIKTDSDVLLIQDYLEQFFERTLDSEVTRGCTEHEVIFALFCATSLAGMATVRDREECIQTLTQLEKYQTVRMEIEPELFVVDENPVAGSCRSLVLEYLFARLVWDELKTRQYDELTNIATRTSVLVKAYEEFLQNTKHETGESQETTQNIYLGRRGTEKYEEVVCSMVKGGALVAINSKYWVRLISRMPSDINKEILMYNILMTGIFAQTKQS